jgi:sulfur-oxidizing protein SoxY
MMTKMTRRKSHRGVTRRAFLAGSGAAVMLGGIGTYRPAAAEDVRWSRIPVIRELIGQAPPRTEGLLLELPLVWEDGAAVPVTVAAESAPAKNDGIHAIHLFATRNPFPEIAVFRFTSLSGRAEASTRIRLNESQTVIAVAEAANGDRLVAFHDIRITRSGCFVRTASNEDDNELASRVRVSPGIKPGVPAEVVTLINHPMETGLRQGTDGAIPPKRLIRSLLAELEGVRVFEAEMFHAVAANPYVRFFIAPEGSGELTLTWTEDTDRRVQARVTVDMA